MKTLPMTLVTVSGAVLVCCLVSARPVTSQVGVAGALLDLRFEAALAALAERSWPPRPEDMVTIDARQFGSGGFVNVPTFSDLTLYSVPADKWLVLCGTSFSGTNSSHSVYEGLGGTETFKMGPQVLGVVITSGEFFAGGGPLGIAFRPGSTVVLRATATGGNVGFHLSGYLVDA